MPWRSLMRYLSNNEELIRRLSESYPIRRAAQLTAYFFNVGKDKFIEHRGKYERAGGWDKTKRDVKDTWENYKELRRQQEKSRTSSSSSSSSSTTTKATTKSTTKNKKPFS
ncbi:unnamed protein product [Rotaria sordida]|uniref:Uncharacterized protein n=1 Tax=Rotaria sordida TaxID=392033 RepID=A0A815C8Z3_9BILA|nr:unnamed protein product [Rotaria sordida]CAF1280243.1 unnamed protein product [Rotaria sordida]